MRTVHQWFLYFRMARSTGTLLRHTRQACYGFRLKPSTDGHFASIFVSNRKCNFCLEHFSLKLFFLFGFLVLRTAFGQNAVHPQKADTPPPDEIWFGGATQTEDNEWKHLKGAACVRTTEMNICAHEIDFNSDTDWTYARGNVRLEHFATGDILNADHAEFNIRTEEGKFYVINGTAPSKILTSPGMLTTTNPFYFQAQWADRIKNRYILHKGFITDCKMPKPWWKFQSPKFDVVPGEHAVVRSGILFVHHLPILYLPYYFRPLGRNPRQSGFLTPNIGNTSLNGYMIGGGYYWAINRSYDADYVLQYFTLRGPASTFNIRGKPNDVSDFSFGLYSVDDKGLPQACAAGTPAGECPKPIKEGGTEMELTGRTQIWGFTAKMDLNYLSSFVFRQAFANSYNTALGSEVHSIGFMQRHFNNDLDSLNFVAQRDQVYEAAPPETLPPNDVAIQKLPAVEVYGRDQQITNALPIYFSFSSSAGLFERQESDVLSNGSYFFLNTNAMPRIDAEPKVSTWFKLAGFTFNPSFGVGLTDYGKDYASNSATFVTPLSCGGYPLCPPVASAYDVAIKSASFLRHDADFVLGVTAPTIERIFTPPAWAHLGAKLKHVIELNATYEDMTGITHFSNIIHFDQTDIFSDTNQVTLDLTNRIYKKDAKGNVSEWLNWHVAYARYFDPTFGGAVVAGQRNEVYSELELATYTFLYEPRNYSPIESALTVNPYPFMSLEYKSAYDPLQHKFIDHYIGTTFRKSNFRVNFSDTAVTSIPLLVPQANQVGAGIAWGTSMRRGWNLGANINYDVLLDRATLEYMQATYNTDCCGFSVQWRHFNFGIRDDNQYLFSFSLANLGTFGSMQKQDRIF